MSEDRISNLPEPLLHHIHSFLDIKDGAHTSVLSKRWNYIWTTVPLLHFENTTFTPKKTKKFMDFVDGTLRRHASNIDKFFLRLAVHFVETPLHSWISALIRGNVKELTLYLNQKQPLSIPLSLFTCESLVSLKLWTDPNVRFPEYISFPRLKCLELREFEFSGECWNEELFSNSTFLEELSLHQCVNRMKNLCISIPTLKILKIIRDYEADEGLKDCTLKIDAPRLVTFSYSGYVAKKFVLSSFPELMEADVNFFVERDGAEMSPLLRAIAHVKCLTVSDATLEAICSAHDLLNNMPTFHNVQTLTISDYLTTDQGLIALLKAVPNLESLVFDEHCVDAYYEDGNDDAEGHGDNDNDDSWVLDIVTNGCLLPRLESVCFHEFVGNPREKKWAGMILRDAKALRYFNCSVHYSDARSEKELMAEIRNLPRASSGCVFKFWSWNNYSTVFHRI